MHNVVLLGHGIGVKKVIETLNNKVDLNMRVSAVITHPRALHDSDLALIEKNKIHYGDYAYNVFNVVSDFGIELLEFKDVNEVNCVNFIKSQNPKYIISIGCRNIIKSTFLAEFERRVLNIHTTPLPKYRGAANDSWMILNGLWGTKQYGCMHFIDEGIDTGDIISKSSYLIPNKAYPIDVFKSRMNTFSEIVYNGIKSLENPDSEFEKQNVNESSVFPRLFTPKDGKINFELFIGEELIRFIYAFGYPFEGAFCFFEEKKVNILEATFFEDKTLHSFGLGIIFGKDEFGNYKVIVRGGFIVITKIELDGKPISQNSLFRLGKRLK